MYDPVIDEAKKQVRQHLTDIWNMPYFDVCRKCFPKVLIKNVAKLSRISRFSTAAQYDGMYGIKDKDNVLLHSLRDPYLAKSFLIDYFGKYKKLVYAVESLLLVHDVPETLSGDVSVIYKYEGNGIDPDELKAAKIVFSEEPLYLAQWKLLEKISSAIKRNECPTTLTDDIYFGTAWLAYLFDRLDGNIFYHYHLNKEVDFCWPNSYQWTINNLGISFKVAVSFENKFPKLYSISERILLLHIKKLQKLWVPKATKKDLEDLSELRDNISY